MMIFLFLFWKMFLKQIRTTQLLPVRILPKIPYHLQRIPLLIRLLNNRRLPRQILPHRLSPISRQTRWA